MEKYNKIIFACYDNTAVSPMAEAIMNKITANCIDICSRGIVVLFSEPCNPKIYSVLKKHDVPYVEGSTKSLMNKDFGSDTVVLVPDFMAKKNTYRDFDAAINVYTIKEFVGLEGDIEEPFGQNEEAYEKLYDELYELLTMAADKLQLI